MNLAQFNVAKVTPFINVAGYVEFHFEASSNFLNSIQREMKTLNIKKKKTKKKKNERKEQSSGLRHSKKPNNLPLRLR